MFADIVMQLWEAVAGLMVTVVVCEEGSVL